MILAILVGFAFVGFAVGAVVVVVNAGRLVDDDEWSDDHGRVGGLRDVT